MRHLVARGRARARDRHRQRGHRVVARGRRARSAQPCRGQAARHAHHRRGPAVRAAATSSASISCWPSTRTMSAICAALPPTGEARAKIHLLRSFEPGAAPGAEVPDPVLRGARRIRAGLRHLPWRPAAACSITCAVPISFRHDPGRPAFRRRGRPGQRGRGLPWCVAAATSTRRPRSRLADGRTVFVKSNDDAPAGMFAAEARGLDWLAEARALRVPAVLARGPEFPRARAPPARRAAGADFDETLGRGLAALHRAGAPGFGLDHDNFIGRLPQANGRCRPGPSSTASAACCRSCAAPSTGAGPARACGAGSSAAASSWRSSSVQPSRPRACTAICGAATPWWTSAASPA